MMVMLVGGIVISVKNSILIGRVTAVAVSNRRRRPDFRPRSTVCVRDSAIKALLYIHNFSFPRFSLSFSYPCPRLRQLRFFMPSVFTYPLELLSLSYPCTHDNHVPSSSSHSRQATYVGFSCISHSVVSSSSSLILSTYFFFLFSLRLTLSRSLRNNMHNKVQCYIHPWISYHGTEWVWGEVKEVEGGANWKTRRKRIDSGYA